MSPEEEAAARLVKVAEGAAEEITRRASAAAAELARLAAHTDPLLVSVYQSIQHSLERISDRLDAGNEWMAQTDATANQMRSEIVSLGQKVAIQNGGVTRALDWMRAHDARMAAAANVAEGRDQIVGVDASIVHAASNFLRVQMPWFISAGAVGLAVLMFMWDRVPI